jgi:phosphonate transport system permease protein
MTVVIQLPDAQLAPLREAYRDASRAKRRQLLLGLVVVAVMVALSAWAAEIDLPRFLANFWRFPDYFVRIAHFDQGPLAGRPVILDIPDWFWGVANGRWLKQLAETVLIAYVGTIMGAVGAFFLAFNAAQNLARPRPAQGLKGHAVAFARRAAWVFAVLMIGGLALDQLARLVGAARLPINPVGILVATLGFAALGALPLTLLTKRFLEFCRTVPEIVFALIFVIAFGLGPVPGVLAIAIHTMGALGKLFAEVVENIDMRPVEGAVATGGTWAEMIRFAVVPQVLSNFASYALLRFEINVRGAAIMGFVGAGGIGQDLIEAIRKFYYADVSALLLLIIATVMVIDLLTEQLRHRLIGMEQSR